MEREDNWLLGLAVFNFVILLYEHQGIGRGWKFYLSLVALLVVGVIFRPLAILLFIPITGYNVLVNTTRLRYFIENRKWREQEKWVH